MKQEVKVTDEAGNVQQCAVMRGCFMEGKSASLGLALLYATGNEGKLYVMDADFVKALLKDINELNAIIHKDVLNNNEVQNQPLQLPDVSDNSYRDFLIRVSEDRKILENERKALLISAKSSDRVKALKMLPRIQTLIQLQDKLINYVAVIENKNISEIRDEFDFTY